jgi:hypothetical protein
MFSADYEQNPSCGMSECQYQHCPAYYEEQSYAYQYAQHYTPYGQPPPLQQYPQQQTLPHYVQQPKVQQYAQPCTQPYVHEQTKYVQQKFEQQTPQYAQHYQAPPQQQSLLQQNYAESSIHPTAGWADFKATWGEYWYFRQRGMHYQASIIHQQLTPE